MLSLRFRILLFFCLLAVAGAGLAAGALFFGWWRAENPLPTAPFVTAFVLFAFLNTGLIAAVWILFDENVAKPINTLSARLRLRAHAGVDAEIGADDARYLGDLAPAANALTQTVSGSLMESAAQVAQETRRLRDEHDRLTALLSEIPLATVLVNPAQEIVLYDGQAAEILSQIAPPRLKAPLSDYFDPAEIKSAMAQLSSTCGEIAFVLHDATRQTRFNARIKALNADGHMIFIDAASEQTERVAARPLVFDFDLMAAQEVREIADTPLSELCFVPFDTETTGLSVAQDDIVQIGAVRVLNGRMVDGETFECYVNPGRAIPPASTRIHHVTDAAVADAPDIGKAGRALHHFARGAVLVAHNALFDIGLLRKYEPRMGVTWDHAVLDTVLLSAVVFGTTEDHSLDALCARLGVTIPGHLRHTALGDARATGEALVKLLPLLEAKGTRCFGDLIQQTRQHGRLLEDLNG
ncbi:exonuclease domain-containing protein [uncultured Roseobacter sp.]|uniref:exonuclease domain-containing protein n=1 Tax=uncultured Roseobacter sp. TaxID=114847 RepID=UPI0026221DA2|nr:exonuclease domain-containing protein [uncultured Roseobacter sp.]